MTMAVSGEFLKRKIEEGNYSDIKAAEDKLLQDDLDYHE